MFKKKQIGCLIAVIVLIVLFLVLASIPRPSLGGLPGRLEAGDIALGSSLDSLLDGDGARAIVEYEVDGWSGGVYSVVMYYSKGEFVSIYAKDRVIFAAQYATGMVGESYVKWYFMDKTIMSEATSVLSD